MPAAGTISNGLVRDTDARLISSASEAACDAATVWVAACWEGGVSFFEAGLAAETGRATASMNPHKVQISLFILSSTERTRSLRFLDFRITVATIGTPKVEMPARQVISQADGA